jgi:hypothetical protein
MSTPRLSEQDLALEGGELLPDKEVLSILDLFVNIDLALDLAAPIDLAVAANANVAAPIDAAATANVLSFGSTATALAQQGVMIDQYISGDAIATAPQDVVLDQSNDVVDPGGTGGDATGGATTEPAPVGQSNDVVDTGGTGGDTPAGDPTAGDAAGADTTGGGATTEPAPAVLDETGNVVDPADPGATTETVGSTTEPGLLDGPLLNVDVDASIDADLAAPVAGAVAANANVAAPIDAAVAANVASIDSSSTAIADQTAIINQSLDDVTASATADQDADITQ